MARTRLLLVLGSSVAILAVGGVAALTAASGAVKEVGPGDPRLSAPLVQLAIAEGAEAPAREFTGTIAARVQSNLGFRVAGKVIARLVDVGQQVKAGQPLLKLDPADLQLALVARQNAAASARAVVSQAAADEARYGDLLKKGWATRQRFEQARATADTARAALAAAEADARVAENQATYAVLTADADGTVVETLGEPGQVVAAGQTVIRLAHAGPREALVALPETVRPAIGSAAQAHLYGGGGQSWPASLRQLSDSADAQTRTYEARYVIDTDAASLPLGATVTVALPGVKRNGGPGGGVSVPVGAVYDDGSKTGLWVFDQATSTVQFRPVTLRSLGEETAILSGVPAGSTVVALGAHLLHDGEAVRAAAGQGGK